MSQSYIHTSVTIECKREAFEIFKNEFLEMFKEGKLYSLDGPDGTYYFNFKEDPILTLLVKKSEIRAISRANTIIIYFR